MSAIKQFEDLSTSYVNLAGLIRQLREQNFVGSIHVSVNQYEAEVQLNGADEPTVSEIAATTRQASQTAGAMERLLVHAREPGGTITVFGPNPAAQEIDEEQRSTTETESETTIPFAVAPPPQPVEVDWTDLLESGGKVIGAVERAVGTIGADFESGFRGARIDLGDDYPFLDPTGNGMNYANKKIVLNEHPNGRVFVTALSECLRRVVNKFAIGKESKRFRETVAIELAVAVRLSANGLREFTTQLDKIAGTRVI